MSTDRRPFFRLRRGFVALLDLVSWAVALYVATMLRWNSLHPRHSVYLGLAVAILIAAGFQLLIGWFTLYRYTWRIGSFEEFAALAMTTAATSGVVVIVDTLALRSSVPLGSAIGGCTLAFVLMAGARGSWRYWQDLRLKVPEGMPGAIIYGAGDAGRQTIDLLVTSADRPYWPMALLDDDPRKKNHQLRHLKVTGSIAQLAEAAADPQASVLIIAITSAESSLIQSCTSAAEALGLEVLVLPPVADLIGGQVSVADIRPVSELDLLGRRTINTDVEAIAHYLTGRRVLVTGAGGSIGSELCRQIKRFGPESLIMLDRDESGLQQVQLSIEGQAMLSSRTLVVCDIRDADGLEAVFSEHEPEVVFHAAALKHLPLLEMYPLEAWKTNVLGTLNVLEAAKRRGVSNFVNISTDKAANPSSVLGYTKRITERLTSGFDEHTPTGAYRSVRFGNVLGSRGSVLTTFWAQVEAGGPITVTHPEVTRYFMTTEEAVQLVIQAGSLKDEAGVFVLDMGPPVKIDEIAQRLAREASPRLAVVYTGLRPGEKLSEDLFANDELPTSTSHPLISQAKVPPLSPRDLESAAQMLSSQHPTATLEALSCLESSLPANAGDRSEGGQA